MCDTAASQEVSGLFQEFWNWRLKRTPEFASLAGNSEYNRELEDYSHSRFEEDNGICQDFLRKISNLEAKNASDSDEAERLNLRLFKAELETFVTGFSFKGFLFPINNIEGVHVDFERLADWMAPSTQSDFEDLIARFDAFEKQADGIVEILRRAVKEGYVNHERSMSKVDATLEKHDVAEPRATAFFAPFENLPDALGAEVAGKLRNEAERAIRNCVQPGMRKIRAFLRTEYKTRADIGASSLPGGAEFYAACVRFHTSTSLTPEEIHRVGLEEVERIECDMKKVMEGLGHGDKPLAEFMNMLRDDPKMFYKSKEDVLEGFKDLLENRINPKITSIFNEFPKLKCEIVESGNAGAPAAYYIGGTRDGARPGKFFVNVANFDSQPKYDMMTLTLHESNPGHHLQGAFLQTLPGIAEFRTVMEDRSYFMAPSRFPINTAYGEGWGLYSEKLGFDLGLYEDPYDRFGHYSAEIFRACRLVVDTGIHALGWTRERAVDFMMSHSAASKANTEAEVDRYITWPGQALGYKIGEIRLRELRARAQEKMAGKFKLADFHDVVLRTAGPLDVLEEEVDKYIDTANK